MTLVLSALSALPTPPGGTVETRREAAEAIVAAAEADPLFAKEGDGSAAVTATALVLAGIAQHESSFDPRVGRCERRGGGAISYFQLLGDFSMGGHSKKEICASPALAAKLALRVLHLHKRRCKGCGPSSWLAGYASGNPKRPSRTSRETEKIVVALGKEAGVDLAMRGAKAPVWLRK